jgi:hypothetical protein
LDLSNLGASAAAAFGGEEKEDAEAEAAQDHSSSSMVGGGGCVFQRAKCMGVHFFGSWFMSLPLQVLMAPEVRRSFV